MIEQLLVHLPDILLAGGGAYLATRSGWKRGLGLGLLVLYAMSIAGMVTGPEPVNTLGIALGVASAAIGAVVGWRRRERPTAHL